MASRNRSHLVLLLLAALVCAWVAAPTFVQPPPQSVRGEAPPAEGALVAPAGLAASWLASSQP
eukprot:CAMPEP_0171091392 /NCGR_PEP_ID=MMETSP0766_2-20121228/33025_1 /TAXON_ID=439317 /ORGANISM="Gambierdiscus australes, Strain CAWD 149" /LENGTH=62 /DNA_ID=CAMNT_0011549495 /DNA_START=52 /DNA_END=236 /DNA_ORIENTATION=+